MSESVRTSIVDWQGGYMRKYWNTRKESLTVRCRSTTAKVSRQCFRNLFRYFLYMKPPGFDEELAALKSEDQELLGHGGFLHDREHAKEALKLEKSVSIQIRAYEKEFFYLKCITMQLKPQIVLRVLLKMAKYSETKHEVFTAPETLFALLHIGQRPPIWRKDVRFVS